MATNNSINNKSEPLTSSTVYATTFDTNVTAAGVTLSGTTLSADGTDANINITVTPKGTGRVSTAANINAAGISFDSGTTTLANYVGTTSWTPTISFGTGTTGITYNEQVGFYSRIGNVIFFSGSITLTSKGSDTGYIRINGLPTNAAASISGGTVIAGNVTYTGVGLISTISSGNSYFGIQIGSNASAALALLSDAHTENNSRFKFSGFYFV